MPSAIAALILSVKERKLLITGASSSSSAPAASENGDTQDDTPRAKQPTLSAMSAKILGPDFTLNHCQGPAKMLDGSTPYVRIFAALDSVSAKGEEQAAEAERFAEKLRGYLMTRNNELIEHALTQPAKALASSGDHMRRLNGTEDLGAATLRAMIEMIGEDTNIRTLSRYFQQFDAITAEEAEDIPTQSTASRKQQLVLLIQRFMDEPGVSGRLIKEAQGLLNKMNNQ
jgi:hypothetical protein